MPGICPTKVILSLSFATIFLMAACRKTNKPSGPHSTSCLDFTVTDSALADSAAGTGGYLSSQDAYFFNAAQQLQKHIVYDLAYTPSRVSYSDSFAYANGNMVKSYFSLDSNNSTAPYTTSEYDYVGNKLAASRYYLGSTLLVHTTYEVDSSGKITSLTQYADNLSYQYTPTETFDLIYDSNGNLLEVTDPGGGVYCKFIKYDNHPNPWYKLPFDFAYNPIDYSIGYFSKNNYQLEYIYQYGDSVSNTLSYNYGPSGKISTFTQTPSSGRVSNGPGVTSYETITYKCD